MAVAHAPSRWSLPFWIAHRGAGKLAPENTLAAFRVGADHGYRAFECDVKLSGDGVAMLLHDATLERTTDGRGEAAVHDWASLSRLDAGGWHGRRFAGEPPATLESIARFCIANRFDLNIEIKPTPGREAETGAAVAQAARQLWQHSERAPLLSSFAPAALAAAMEAAPELQRALLIDNTEADWPREAARLACVAVVADHRIIDAAMAEAVHAGGRRLLAYTVNDEATARRLAGCGIDGLITDAVDRFAPADDRV